MDKVNFIATDTCNMCHPSYESMSSCWIKCNRSQAQAPIDHIQCAVGQRGDMRVMRHDDQCAAMFAAELTKQIHHLEARGLVKAAGRLVGQQQGRRGDQGACNSYPLLLASR